MNDDPLAAAVASSQGQPSTVRVGTVTSINPLQITLGGPDGTVLNPAAVGLLQSYIPQIGDPVALLGQTVEGAEGSASTWLALGTAGGTGRLPSIVGYGSRDTSTGTTTGTALPVLRVDNIKVKLGNQYAIRMSTLLFSSVAANTSATMRTYLQGGGAAATTASQVVKIFNSGFIPTTADGIFAFSERIWTPTADDTLSILMGIFRLSGTGNVSSFASATVAPTEIVIVDLGRAVANTGVAL
jgi:hypothetical protein